jgi:transposase InsO family protein
MDSILTNAAPTTFRHEWREAAFRCTLHRCRPFGTNRTFREEFYACRDLISDSIGAMRFELRKAIEKYNKFRPHHALKGKTPIEYLRINQADAA